MMAWPTTPTSRRLNPAAAMPPATRWSCVAVALLLSACAHSPQAAVPTPGLQSGAMPREQTAISPCDKEPTAKPALERIGRELQSQGMALQANCNAASGGWVVQVQVVDGVRATKTVRGPLADGQAVDMGTPAGVGRANAALEARGFSPDVEHNRQWLRALMARHQFVNLPDAWWHFAQRGAGSPGGPEAGGETDLAAR